MSKEAKLRKAVRDVAKELVEMQRRLFDVGLIKTAHQLNGATKTLGWEAEEVLERSFKEPL